MRRLDSPSSTARMRGVEDGCSSTLTPRAPRSQPTCRSPMLGPPARSGGRGAGVMRTTRRGPGAGGAGDAGDARGAGEPLLQRCHLGPQRRRLGRCVDRSARSCAIRRTRKPANQKIILFGCMVFWFSVSCFVGVMVSWLPGFLVSWFSDLMSFCFSGFVVYCFSGVLFVRFLL